MCSMCLSQATAVDRNNKTCNYPFVSELHVKVPIKNIRNSIIAHSQVLP